MLSWMRGPGGAQEALGVTFLNAHALVRNVRPFGGGVGREPYCGQEYDGRRPGQQVAVESLENPKDRIF